MNVHDILSKHYRIMWWTQVEFLNTPYYDIFKIMVQDYTDMILTSEIK